MTAPAAVRSTQEYDATFCGLWPETRFGPQPHREPRAVQSPTGREGGKANSATEDLFEQHWGKAHNMSRGIALNDEDTGHGPYRRINPIARKQLWQNPLNEQQRNRGHGPTHEHKLRETTRTQGYHDPLERFTPLPVGGADAANQLHNFTET